MDERDYMLATAAANLRMACAAFSQIDLPDGWEADDLALARAWQTATRVEQKVRDEIEAKVEGQYNDSKGE